MTEPEAPGAEAAGGETAGDGKPAADRRAARPIRRGRWPWLGGEAPPPEAENLAGKEGSDAEPGPDGESKTQPAPVERKPEPPAAPAAATWKPYHEQRRDRAAVGPQAEPKEAPPPARAEVDGGTSPGRVEPKAAEPEPEPTERAAAPEPKPEVARKTEPGPEPESPPEPAAHAVEAAPPVRPKRAPKARRQRTAAKRAAPAERDVPARPEAPTRAEAPAKSESRKLPVLSPWRAAPRPASPAGGDPEAAAAKPAPAKPAPPRPTAPRPIPAKPAPTKPRAEPAPTAATVAEPRVERFLIYERLWASGLPTVAAIASVQARAFLVSPLLYVTSAVSLLLTAVLVYLPDLAGGRPVVMGDILSLMELVMTFAVPLYTMGLLADERRIGTLEVLLTSAVRSWELVAGRWMAGLAAFVVTVVPSLAYVVLVSVQQPLRDDYGLFGHHVRLALVDYGAIATGYVGVILLGAAWVAVGLLASSLVSRRAVAAIVAMAALLALYVAGDHLSLPAPLAALAESLNARSHAQPFLDGRLTPGDLVYFASLAVAALMLATGVLGMRRWRP